MTPNARQALDGVMAMVAEACSRTWEVEDGPRIVHDMTVPVYKGHIADFVDEDDAKAAAAAINYLRQHGATLRAALDAGERDRVDADYFRWLAVYPNFYTVCDLLRADQYVTLRRACEALQPLDAARGNGGA